MKNKLLSIFFTLLVAASLVAQQQQDPLGYLRQQCPQLTERYSDELKNCHAHYIFAVDVSLSMCKYENLVKPALAAFAQALPNGDCVTVIPFAKSIITSQMGFNQDLIINPESKESFVAMMSRLYPKDSERKDKVYYDTDIYQAQKAILETVQKAGQFDVNIIVIISDLLHCPANNVDRQFNNDEMTDMHNKMKSSYHANAEYMVFTLELPQSGKPAGYVFPQLQELYDEWGVKVDQKFVPNNSEDMIGQWFAQQKNNIMFRKLQTIIIRENKANPIVVKTQIDIDGNVMAHIEWKATKLYPMITLDTTYISNSDFRFKANPEYINYSEAGQMCADLDLGQIKHKDFGFHTMADTLHFDVKLPVEYQSEIVTLLDNRPGALANTSVYGERLIFTFFLPLWLTITLIVLFILYIIGVFKAIGRNNKLCFKANITVYDAEGNQIDDMRRMGKQGTNAVIKFGADGTQVARVDDAEWQFEIRKQNGNPFLVFVKPKFVWKKTRGYCAAGKAQSGILSYDSPTSINLRCGSSATEVTHKIKVQLTK